MADILGVEDGVFVEHRDVTQDEATKAESKSGLPLFAERFATQDGACEFHLMFCVQMGIAKHRVVHAAARSQPSELTI